MFNFFSSSTSPKNLVTQTLSITGMHCTSCSINIDATLEDLPGVTKSVTKFNSATTTVTYNPQITNLDPIIAAIKSLNYQATPST